tara:strand:+ start:557 stop:1354 length:798 start_codon:yes stop_codon:yes gene_type:complete
LLKDKNNKNQTKIKGMRLKTRIKRELDVLSEQANPGLGQPIMSKSCNAPGGGGGSSHRIIVDDNGTLRDPIVGDAFCAGAHPGVNNWSYFQQYGCTSKITQLLDQCDGCDWANGAPYVPGPGGCGNKCNKPPRTYTLLSGGCTDPSCCSGNCTDCTTTTSACDTSTASPCAVQWFQNPNATWASNWITNRDCSNYNWPGNNLPVQALQLMSSAPNPQPGPYNSWNDIWTKANAAWPNTTGAPKNTFIGKMAKGRYAECQIAACNC